eukprot:7160228-Lingulodinium_polyedra.AAC.1
MPGALPWCTARSGLASLRLKGDTSESGLSHPAEGRYPCTASLRGRPRPLNVWRTALGRGPPA